MSKKKNKTKTVFKSTNEARHVKRNEVKTEKRKPDKMKNDNSKQQQRKGCERKTKENENAAKLKDLKYFCVEMYGLAFPTKNLGTLELMQLRLISHSWPHDDSSNADNDELEAMS